MHGDVVGMQELTLPQQSTPPPSLSFAEGEFDSVAR